VKVLKQNAISTHSFVAEGRRCFERQNGQTPKYVHKNELPHVETFKDCNDVTGLCEQVTQMAFCVYSACVPLYNPLFTHASHLRTAKFNGNKMASKIIFLVAVLFAMQVCIG